MVKEEFSIIATALASAYPGHKVIPDMDSMKLWYTMLGDLDYELASLAVQKCVMKYTFPPSIAQFRDEAMSIISEPDKDWSEGWREVKDAIKHFGYMNGAEALASMSPVTRKCVERLGWMELCMSENEVADRKRFADIFSETQKREKETRAMPEKLRLRIESLQRQALGIGANNAEVQRIGSQETESDFNWTR